MKRRILVIVFFIVVFGLPVAWYLFLQVFGENRFALPVIGEWDQKCLVVTEPALVIKSGSFDQFPNQWKRVTSKVDQQQLISIREIGDCELTNEMYLVDESGLVRGQFMISREEIDRLLAEMDIFILNHYETNRN